MTSGIADRLTEYLLGLLSADEVAEVEAILDADPTACEALAQLEADLDLLDDEAFLSTEPAPMSRGRLLDALNSPEERFAPFTQRLSKLMDIGRDTARKYLTDTFHIATTGASPWPGIGLLHVDGGPRTEGADVGFVYVPPDTEFPSHHHVGSEHTLVLQGGYVEGDGTEVRAGDFVVRDADTDHTFRSLPGEPLIFAVVVFGVDFDDPVDLHEDGHDHHHE